MTQNDMPSYAADPTWWRAPLVASLSGLPLIVWEYALWGVNAFHFFAGAVGWALALLLIAWALPHRRSARMLRITAAVAGVVFALLPMVFVVLMGIAMASG
jgi:hypothetical protein